ncbi:MAG: hypothetical protein E6J44_10310 [Chloroflexi bacterium]|nr:MAG: hypothetical protein E6J44_10310 [Chloroflexota bacterium]
MAPPQKPFNDRAAGEIMLTEVFKVVQRLNAAAGPSMVKKGTRSGNMTFNPKIILADDGSKHYTCFVEIYTQASSKAGTEMSMEWSSTNIEQFKQALTTLFHALSALAKEGYLADTFTVGRISPVGEETEVYAPSVLEPGMYSLSEAEEA